MLTMDEPTPEEVLAATQSLTDAIRLLNDVSRRALPRDLAGKAAAALWAAATRLDPETDMEAVEQFKAHLAAAAARVGKAVPSIVIAPTAAQALEAHALARSVAAVAAASESEDVIGWLERELFIGLGISDGTDISEVHERMLAYVLASSMVLASAVQRLALTSATDQQEVVEFLFGPENLTSEN